MKNNSNYFNAEQSRVNDTFFSADGFVDYNNFYGETYSANGFVDYNNFYGNEYSADGCGASSPRTISSNPYTFLISNSAATDISSVLLLGANQNTILGTTNFNNTGSITITQQNGSITYAQFLQNLKSMAFTIGQIQLQSSNTSQPFQNFTISQTNPDGATSSLPQYPVINPFQQQSGVAIINQIIPVNSWTQFTFTLLASASMTVRLYPAQTLDVSKAVIGAPVTQAYNNPRITGVPQLPMK